MPYVETAETCPPPRPPQITVCILVSGLFQETVSHTMALRVLCWHADFLQDPHAFEKLTAEHLRKAYAQGNVEFSVFIWASCNNAYAAQIHTRRCQRSCQRWINIECSSPFHMHLASNTMKLQVVPSLAGRSRQARNYSGSLTIRPVGRNLEIFRALQNSSTTLQLGSVSGRGHGMTGVL